MARLIEILTVCGAGFGTSLLLRMAVDDILAEEGLHAKVAAWDSGTAKSQNVDIIVTTEDLARQLDGFKGKIVSVFDITDKKTMKAKFLPVFKEIQAQIDAKK